MVLYPHREVIFLAEHLITNRAGGYKKSRPGLADEGLIEFDQLICLLVFPCEHQRTPTANASITVKEEIINTSFFKNTFHGYGYGRSKMRHLSLIHI